MSRSSWTRAGRAGELRPVLLLVLVVAIPTLGVLWFAGVAMQNQQLATRQLLADAYRPHLSNLQNRIQQDWLRVGHQVDTLFAAMPPEQVFARVADLEYVDAVICLNTEGATAYPSQEPLTADQQIADPRWQRALAEEFEWEAPRNALQLYEELAGERSDVFDRLMILQARMRCLLKLHEKQSAVSVALRTLEDLGNDSLDARAQSTIARVEMTILENLPDRGIPRDTSGANDEQRLNAELILGRLVARLHDYSPHTLAASQRLFLMKRLENIAPGHVDLKLLGAEQLAAEFLASDASGTSQQFLQPSASPPLWHAQTPSQRAVLLLKTGTLQQLAVDASAGLAIPSDTHIDVLPPGETSAEAEFVGMSAGESLPGWRLAFSLGDRQRIDAAATQRNRLHLWTGALVVLCTSVLALWMTTLFRRELRVAKLKNDLVGTVSHELKTPLSSMRLLVDTLLAEPELKQDTTREYLELISKENLRLSRLIENFLTFTRMERGRHVFDFQPLDAVELVGATVQAAGERFREPDCELDVNVAENLPTFPGDKDALVTVLLNLMDNAYKYSSGTRRIALRAAADRQSVCFSVADNGIGLSRSASRKVFSRYYQVDQRLARETNGCGLGLSIVQHIVRGHGGTVTVDSDPGEGSTFTVKLPIGGRAEP